MITVKSTFRLCIWSIILLSVFPMSCIQDKDALVTPDTNENITVIKPGLFSIDGNEVKIGINTNEANDLWMVASNDDGEALGVLATRETPGKSTIYGALYRDSTGNSLKILIDSIGRPDTVLVSDGTMMVFSNYESGSIMAKISHYDTDGELVTSEHVTMNNSLFELMALVNEHGLTMQTSDGLEKTSMNFAVQGKVRTGSLVLKITGTIVSAAGCVIGATTSFTGVGGALAVMSCISATQGLLSTFAYIYENDKSSEAFGLSSAAWGVVACFATDWASCFTTALAYIDLYVSGCRVENIHADKKCKDGWVTWVDDCGNPSEFIEECPCECIDAACIPIESCGTDLTLDVTIGASPPCDSVGQYLLFTAQVLGEDDVSSIFYNWSFGDGGTSVLKEDTHAYKKNGIYIVTLKVNDTKGNYGFATLTVEIGECSKVSQVIAESNTDCAEVNKPVNFSSLVTGGDKSRYTYMWLFGDGEFSSEAHPTHTFTKAGTYSVFLEVTGPDSGIAEVSFSQKVGNCTPSLDVAIAPLDACVDTGKSVSFNAEVEGADPSALTYNWNFGDGTSSSSQSPTHTYTKTGDLTVELEISNDQDSTASASATLHVGDCSDTSLPFEATGWIVYTELDTTQKPYVPNMRVMNLETLESYGVTMPEGSNVYPVGVSANGTIVMGAIDNQSGDWELLVSRDWGATTPERLQSTCKDSGYHWTQNDVSVSADGVVYFHGTYDSSYFDESLQRERNTIVHTLFAIPTDSVGCSCISADLDGDGDIRDEFWEGTDVAIGYTGNQLLFSPGNASENLLYSINISEGIANLLNNQYHSGMQVSADGSRCVFTIEGSEVINPRFSMATAGGAAVDLSAATGLSLMPEGSFLNYDGSTLVSWALDITEGKIDLVLVKTDGSSFDYIDTKGVKLCSHTPGGYTADGTGIIFVGTEDADISQAAGEIYHIDLENGTVSNLTNTPHLSENTLFVR